MRPGTSQGAAASVPQCRCLRRGSRRLPGSARCQSSPGGGWSPRCCSCSGTAPVPVPVPVPITPFLFAPWVHPCLCRIRPSPGAGRSLPGRVCAQPCAQSRHLPRSRGPSPPWSPTRGVEPWLCLACLAMQGNSQFPRELLSPGQPCSPNIYISHYCLHMSLFSGGVSSFPLLPQCSPCSTSSGAAIPNAVLCSHYCLINLQGKAKLS